MSALSDRQQEFTVAIAKLIMYADSLGYKLTFGDAYRDPRVHGEQGVKRSYSEGTSAHKQRLAVDFNLFINGVYRPDAEAHAALGAFWKSIGGSWGGDFKGKNGGDANHYSFEFGGVK